MLTLSDKNPALDYHSLYTDHGEAVTHGYYYNGSQIAIYTSSKWVKGQKIVINAPGLAPKTILRDCTSKRRLVTLELLAMDYIDNIDHDSLEVQIERLNVRLNSYKAVLNLNIESLRAKPLEQLELVIKDMEAFISKYNYVNISTNADHWVHLSLATKLYKLYSNK